MGTKGKVALLALMVGLVAALFIWDRVSQERDKDKEKASAAVDATGSDSFSSFSTTDTTSSFGSTPSGSLTSDSGSASSTPGAAPASSPSTSFASSSTSTPPPASFPSAAPSASSSSSPAGYPQPASPAGSPARPVVVDGPSRPATGPGASSPAGAPGTAPAGPGSSLTPPAAAFSPFEPKPAADPWGTSSSSFGTEAKKTYKIQQGDSLWTIAQKHYKDGTKWKKILEANKEKIGDGKLLKVGTEIEIPEADAAASTSSPAASDASGGTLLSDEYKVKEGDTLSSIAKSQLGSEALWEALAEANAEKLGGNPNRLKVGMVLRIPSKSEISSGAGAGTPDLKPAEVPPELAGRRTYRVKSGDSLWKIAEKELGNGTKWEKIYDLNRDRIDRSHLKVGQVIVLPDEDGGSKGFAPSEKTETGTGFAPLEPLPPLTPVPPPSSSSPPPPPVTEPAPAPGTLR